MLVLDASKLWAAAQRFPSQVLVVGRRFLAIFFIAAEMANYLSPINRRTLSFAPDIVVRGSRARKVPSIWPLLTVVRSAFQARNVYFFSSEGRPGRVPGEHLFLYIFFLFVAHLITSSAISFSSSQSPWRAW